MFRATWILCLSLLFLAGPLQALIGNPVAGKAKSGICIACHGVDGNSPTPIWPSIAGLDELYFIKQLHDFKQGEDGPRHDPSMLGILATLQEKDFADLAAYFAMQKVTISEIPEDKVELGRQIYRGGNPKTGVAACVACHGVNGEGNSLAKFPGLSGQNPEYVSAQLQKFKDGQRRNDINGIMQGVVARMSDVEIDAVSHYVSGLH